MKVKEKLVFSVIIFCMLSLVIFSSGCLGQKKTCPDCQGVGRVWNWQTLSSSSCPKCGGDGKVGLFIDDDGIEDLLSYIIVGIIIIVIIVGIYLHASKQKYIPRCQQCNEPLTFIPQYQKWYCHRCQEYK